MSGEYIVFHRKNIIEAKYAGNEFEDTITWEPACPEDIYNKYKSISNLQLAKNNTIIKINYWLLSSAISWFVENKHNFDPATTIPIKLGLIKRINLQKSLYDIVPVEEHNIYPNSDKLISDFNKYLQNKNSISEKDLILMKVFLHIGDTKGFLIDWLNENGEKITGKEIRDNAIAKIATSNNQSWLLRETSIVSSDFIKAYCITYKNVDGEINHTPIAHIYGFGYVILNVNREAVMPNEDSKAIFPNYTGNIHASFIDLLEELVIINKFNIKNVIKNIQIAPKINIESKITTKIYQIVTYLVCIFAILFGFLYL